MGGRSAVVGRRLVLILASALFTWSGTHVPAPASEPPVVIVGVEEVFYPPHYDGSGGDYTGFAREMFDRFAADCGCVFEYRPMPIDRLYRALLDGDVDLKFPDDTYWQPEQKAGHDVHYSDPIAAYLDGVSVPVGNVLEPANMRLGTIRGFTTRGYEHLADGDGVVLEYNAHLPALLQQVLIGRLDGAYANVDVVQFILREELGAPGALQFEPSLPYTRSFYRASTTKRPTLIQELNGWLSDNAGWLDMLRREHGLPAAP